MLGNWATGKLRMVSEPTSTRMIDMTIATMGRLMKNFDIGLFCLRFRRKRLGVHEHARAHLLNSLGDNVLAGLEPLSDD